MNIRNIDTAVLSTSFIAPLPVLLFKLKELISNYE